MVASTDPFSPFFFQSKEGFSVFGLVNRCISLPGRRMLRSWFLKAGTQHAGACGLPLLMCLPLAPLTSGHSLCPCPLPPALCLTSCPCPSGPAACDQSDHPGGQAGHNPAAAQER